eukprot:GHVQ01038534.1.p1 GENE.GHVQ01038534.1~~GHVQ01038534.1.p1  ORF type:complete len:620 (+),score=85.83 GHVQ01038534.1:149-2008(+)
MDMWIVVVFTVLVTCVVSDCFEPTLPAIQWALRDTNFCGRTSDPWRSCLLQESAVVRKDGRTAVRVRREGVSVDEFLEPTTDPYALGAGGSTGRLNKVKEEARIEQEIFGDDDGGETLKKQKEQLEQERKKEMSTWYHTYGRVDNLTKKEKRKLKRIEHRIALSSSGPSYVASKWFQDSLDANRKLPKVIRIDSLQKLPRCPPEEEVINLAERCIRKIRLRYSIGNIRTRHRKCSGQRVHQYTVEMTKHLSAAVDVFRNLHRWLSPLDFSLAELSVLQYAYSGDKFYKDSRMSKSYERTNLKKEGASKREATDRVMTRRAETKAQLQLAISGSDIVSLKEENREIQRQADKEFQEECEVATEIFEEELLRKSWSAVNRSIAARAAIIKHTKYVFALPDDREVDISTGFYNFEEQQEKEEEHWAKLDEELWGSQHGAARRMAQRRERKWKRFIPKKAKPEPECASYSRPMPSLNTEDFFPPPLPPINKRTRASVLRQSTSVLDKMRAASARIVARGRKRESGVFSLRWRRDYSRYRQRGWKASAVKEMRQTGKIWKGKRRGKEKEKGMWEMEREVEWMGGSRLKQMMEMSGKSGISHVVEEISNLRKTITAIGPLLLIIC